MLFSRLRDWVARVCAGAAARPLLYAISFAESIFFPIPVDVALAPVVASQPGRWVWITVWCVLASVAGAVAAYFLAAMFWEALVAPTLTDAGLAQARAIADQLNSEGFIIVLISAFTPIPYKVCALSAGLASMPLTVFVAASLLGRGIRFGLVSWLVITFREDWVQMMRRYTEPVGLAIALALVAYLVYVYV